MTSNEDLPGKVIVPADFGIENVDSKLHGNITLKLEGYSEMLANSIILSLNSPVFLDMFKSYETRIVDMRGYTASVVKLFIEALYTGRISIQKHDLKDFSMLASNYKIAWLILKCHNYYVDLLTSLDAADDNDMFMLFEEACSLKIHIGDSHYLEQILEKIKTTGKKLSDFIVKYTNLGYLSFSRAQIDLIVQLNPDDYSVFLKIIQKNVAKNQLFDATSRVLLQQLDLVRSMELDLKLYKEVVDLILKKIVDISRQDKAMIQELNRNAMDRYNAQNVGKTITRSDSVSFAARAMKSLKRMGTKTELQLLPSKYHVFQCYNIMEDLKLDDFLDILSLSSEVKSLFMLLESIDMFGCWEKFTCESLRKVISTVKFRDWSRIPRLFLRSLYWLNDDSEKKTSLNECSAICSDTNHTIMTSNEITTPRRFLLEKKFYKFIFPRPRTTNCIILPTQCGVLVGVIPANKDSSENFKMYVVEDAAVYTEYKMHYHKHIVVPERMHFVVEMFNEGQEDGINMEISWARGQPEFKQPRVGSAEGDQIIWGGWQWGDTHKARLVLYYDNTQ